MLIGGTISEEKDYITARCLFRTDIVSIHYAILMAVIQRSVVVAEL
jgi:hypothetical protein